MAEEAICWGDRVGTAREESGGGAVRGAGMEQAPSKIDAMKEKLARRPIGSAPRGEVSRVAVASGVFK